MYQVSNVQILETIIELKILIELKQVRGFYFKITDV